MRSDAYRLLHPAKVVLVSSVGDDGKPNVITLAWNMPASFSPQMLAISVGKTRHSHRLIKESREFVVNIPSADLKDQVLLCGSTSGKDTDKFSEAGLTQEEAEKVKAPLIKECLASIECRLVNECDAGDHTIFVGEVVAVKDRREGKSLFHAGGSSFIEF